MAGAIETNVYGVKQIRSSKDFDFGAENVWLDNKRLAVNERLPERTGSLVNCLQGSIVSRGGAIDVCLGEAWRAERRDGQNG
jgi:hypothetical protein